MKMSFNLESCHGIKSLNYTFDFSNNKPYIIHAPNGTFKTSFCNTINEYSSGVDSKDLITGEMGRREILLDGEPAPKDYIVIYSKINVDKLYENSKNLLVNKSSREAYEKAIRNYENIRDAFIKKVADKLGVKNIESAKVLLNFLGDGKIDDVLIRNYRKALKVRPLLIKIEKYDSAFGTAVDAAFQKINNQEVVKKINKINKRLLTKHSKVLDNSFDINNLININTTLKDNNFFVNDNCLIFGGKLIIHTVEEFEQLIKKISNTISKDPKYQKAFLDMKQSFSRKGVSKVSVNISKNVLFAKEYSNYTNFKKRYLLNVLKELSVEYSNVVSLYKKTKKEIKKIESIAGKEESVWIQVVNEFNHRFDFPFHIEITRTKGNIFDFGGTSFIFVRDEYTIDKDKFINEIASEGEKRVLFLLDTLFEVENYKIERKNKMLVFDDACDMFDYANKHCVIEYLYEIAKEELFNVLVLTHNFDFYRHFGLKVCDRSHSLFATSDGNGNIRITKGEYLKNVFVDFLKKEAQKPGNLTHALSLIPFTRTLFEISGDKKCYNFLTELLHYRPQTGSHYVGKTLNALFCYKINISCPSLDVSERIYSMILKEGLHISSGTSVDQNIQEKIVLSMALRIMAEKYMYLKLKKNHTFDRDIEKLECGKLFESFKKVFPQDKSNKIIKIICILTSADIHVNGFAYEPLVDYSIKRLRTLFKDFNKLMPSALRVK